MRQTITSPMYVVEDLNIVVADYVINRHYLF